MKSYAAQQRKPTDYIVAVVVAVLAMGSVTYALMSGKVAKLIHQEPIKTEVIKETPKPPPPPPPPPPPVMEQPPPPYIPPPKINVPPPPHPIQRVTHVKPPHPQPPSPTPSPEPVPAPSPPSPPVPAVPDHTAGASPINGAKPQYPDEAQEENREGKVTASCDILPNGRTANCTIVSSTGGHEFVESAEDFLRRARYQPAIVNGQPVTEHHHILHVDFTMGDE